MSASAHPPSRAPEHTPARTSDVTPGCTSDGRSDRTSHGTSDRIIPDRGEFVDALCALRRGHVLVQLGDDPRSCILDGGRLFWSFPTLLDYGLIAEFDNPAGLPNVHYYRMTHLGATFADRACAAWRRWPLLERLAVRLSG